MCIYSSSTHSHSLLILLLLTQTFMMVMTTLVVGIVFLQADDDFGGVQDRCVQYMEETMLVNEIFSSQ